MTTSTQASSAATEEQEPLAEVIPEPAYVRTETPNGVPLFIIAHEAAFDQIESQENCPPIYFCLMGLERSNNETIPSKRIEWSEPALFKRIARSATGNGLIRHPNTDNLGMVTMKESAYWELPPIPLEMVRKLEAFFRAAYRKHTSEAIVMLTYDPDYRDQPDASDGWGILVPKQVNNAGHCKYEWDSVMEDKPEHVDIIGSVHSHPNMSAFASHTDEEDMMNWDGLHITCGWQNSKNNGAAEWFIEYQLNNRRFEFTPAQVFEVVGDSSEFEDEDGWLDKIEKQTSQYGSGGKALGAGSSSTTRTGSPSTGGAASRRSPSQQFAAFFRDLHNSKRPTGCPDIVKNTLIVPLLPTDEGICPVCDEPLGEMSKVNRRCTACFTYVLLDGEKPEAILEARRGRYGGIPYLPGLEYLMGREGSADVVLWDRDPSDPEDHKKATTEKLWTPGKAEGGTATA